MRLGINPAKNKNKIELENYHRIVVPVYIPHFNDYFKDSLKIFKLCIESLLLTVHSKTRITIYNNNSHKAVKEFIDKKYEENILIDQVFHSKENLGKINAILASSKGNLEPLITITDSDVLFKNNWQKEVEELFLGFPEAGMISPVPSSKAMFNFTANNWSYSVIKGKLSFQKVEDPNAMHLFDLSLGNENFIYTEEHLKKYLVLKSAKNKKEAVMGCGHFVATLKREVFDIGTNEPSFIKIVGGVERKFIDQPNEDLGYLRLATKGNYAFHLGNVYEDWMFEEFNKAVKEESDGIEAALIPNKRLSKFSTSFGKFYIRILRKRKIRQILFKKLGLETPENYPL